MLRGTHFNETYSVTCLISLDRTKPTFITGRTNSNDQLDFIQFLLQAIADGYLIPGDTLICDNARIHGGLETFPILQQVLNSANIFLRFLPCYSPELSPVELVFMKVKRYLREYRNSSVSLWTDIAIAFSFIELEDLIKYYKKCLSIAEN